VIGHEKPSGWFEVKGVSMSNYLQNWSGNRADIGKALVEEAQKQVKQQKIAQVSGEVQRMLQGIEECERLIARHKETITLYQDRIDQIEQGAFTVDTNRMGVNGNLVYEIERLNEMR
jgi:hypothetical protein